MAIQLLVNGVDKTSYLQYNPPPRFTRKQNERSTVELAFKPGFLPSLYDDFVLNDGATPVFRGVLVPHIRELDRGPMDVGVDATGYDYGFFFDRCYWSKTYTGSKTALQILTDLQSEKLAAYSITIDGAQDAGDSFVDFTIIDMKVSDVLRQLGSAHLVPRVYNVSPTRTLRLYEPGSSSAPFAVTDSAASFYTMNWTYSDVVPANDVTILFGPTGLGDPITYEWLGDGSSTLFNLAGVSPQASSVWPGYVTVNSVFTPLWPVGTGPTDSIEWDFATNSGELNFKGTTGPPGVGITIVLTYTPQLPFAAHATTGASPKLEARFTNPSVPTFAVAQSIVDSKLLELNQSPRNVMLTTWQYCEPGQLLSIQNAKRSIPSPVDFTIGEVMAEYTEFFSLGTRLWVYTIRATETTSYQGSYIDRARELFGGGSSGSVGIPTGGGPVTLPALPSGYIWVGDATNVAQAVVMTGDASISNTGFVTVTGGTGGMTALATNQVYVGNGSNVATSVAMSGDIAIVSSGATTIQAGVIFNANINASAAIVDTKLATIATAGKVSNSATTATSANTANAIVARDSSGDFSARVHVATVGFDGPVVTNSGGNLTVQASGFVDIHPTGDLYLQPTGSDIFVANSARVSSGSYSSGFSGSGYILDYGSSFGSQSYLEVDRLTVRGIMSVYELLVHQIRATNGSIFVSSTGRVKTATFNGGVNYTIVTEGDHGFAVDDAIRAQRFTTAGGGAAVYQSNCYVTIVFSTTQFNVNVDSGDAPAVGMDFVRLGNSSDSTRRASIYLTADDTNAPYINILDGVASFADWGTSAKIKARIGNLNGAYGYSSNIYGAAFGDNATAWIKIDPTNGVRIGHNATTMAQIDASGNASFTGAITAASGAIGGWVIGTDYIRDVANVAGMASTVTGGDDVRFWAGAAFASRASAPFRVTESGALVATSATITGTVTASLGAIGGWEIGTNYLVDSAGKLALVSSGPYISIGNPRPPDYATNAGIWAGNDGGTYKFRAGTPGGAGFFWDGSAASFSGDGGSVTNINGGNIQTGTITAAKIGAHEITAAQIAVGTITATEIASNAITTVKLDALAVTAAKIAAGTITTNEIDANTITAGNMDVSTLSAISANLGTITAGTISGTTFYAGGTDVVLDSNGLTLSHGGFTAAKIKWTDGSFIVSGSNSVNINGTSGFNITTNGMNLSYMSGGGDRYVYVDNSGTLVAGASYP